MRGPTPRGHFLIQAHKQILTYSKNEWPGRRNDSGHTEPVIGEPSDAGQGLHFLVHAARHPVDVVRAQFERLAALGEQVGMDFRKIAIADVEAEAQPLGNPVDMAQPGGGLVPGFRAVMISDDGDQVVREFPFAGEGFADFLVRKAERLALFLGQKAGVGVPILDGVGKTAGIKAG